MLVKYEYPRVAFHGSGFAAVLILREFVNWTTKITCLPIQYYTISMIDFDRAINIYGLDDRF